MTATVRTPCIEALGATGSNRCEGAADRDDNAAGGRSTL